MVQKHTLFILLNINVAIVMLMYDIKFPIEIDGFYCKGRIILVLGNNKLKHTQITSEPIWDNTFGRITKQSYPEFNSSYLC